MLLFPAFTFWCSVLFGGAYSVFPLEFPEKTGITERAMVGALSGALRTVGVLDWWKVVRSSERVRG